jgi:hypothetical protein
MATDLLGRRLPILYFRCGQVEPLYRRTRQREGAEDLVGGRSSAPWMSGNTASRGRCPALMRYGDHRADGGRGGRRSRGVKDNLCGSCTTRPSPDRLKISQARRRRPDPTTRTFAQAVRLLALRGAGCRSSDPMAPFEGLDARRGTGEKFRAEAEKRMHPPGAGPARAFES